MKKDKKQLAFSPSPLILDINFLPFNEALVAMQIVALIIGILVAIVLIVHFKKTRMENSKFAYCAPINDIPFLLFCFRYLW